MNIDEARKYVVIVNGGSGCFLQPMTDEYIYVLTAKHNITDEGNKLEKIIYFEFENNVWTDHKIEIEQLIENKNYFPHPDKDIAIIKVQSFPSYDEAYRFDRLSDEKNDFCLLGYPGIRRNGNLNDIVEWYRIDNNLQICDDRGKGQFEAGIPGNPTIDEIKGDSGGCVVKIIDEKLFIAGIQNRMADKTEQMGRVRFTAIRSFDEIVEKNPEKLAPILPCHLKSFSFLKNEAFNLNGGRFVDKDIRYTERFLRDKAQSVIKSPLTPIGIKKLFENRLLLFNQKSDVLHSKDVWIIWLEFLTILNILKNTDYTEELVKNIFNNIRLICSDTKNDWTYELTNIVKSDYRGLKKNGIVVIGVSKSPADEDTYILEKKIPQIANAIKEERNEHERGLLKIDDGINFPLDDFKFIHIEYFKKQAIIRKHAEYADIDNEDSLLEKLRTEYQILQDHE